ncbi:MAG: sodium:solute symporter family protein [Lewinella sp.]|nr:sodium:solute symporter family protein [Lewinella sp.]
MITAFLIAGATYLALLVFLSAKARSRNKDSGQYLMAGSNIGAVLGMFTFAATLFSTFTILGMPDFFRTHGVGSWIFLAVSDGVMVFGIIWVGYYFRKKARSGNYFGMAGFMEQQFQSRFAGYVTFFGAFVFLIPYVAIQIRGVAIFFQEVFPGMLPVWGWSSAMVLVMLIYSEVGGLKAIIYSDMMQGILLLIAIWIIGAVCVSEVGGLETMFARVEESNPALLSAPGPKGLFDFQFLFGSMIAIMLLPFTQPQISTRIVIMRDRFSLYRMAVGIGFFIILVILPTAFMGMYGAILYPDAATSEFLGAVLVRDQPKIVAAFAMIGLLAAALSTADSQIFGLGSEIRSLMKGEDAKMVRTARISIGVFAVLALIFAVLTTDQLVLLARTSFAGTSLMAPMIFTGIFSSNAPKARLLLPATGIALLVFISSQMGWIPNMVFHFRLDLTLIGLLTLLAAGIQLFNQTKQP